jgi:hypothetical protein
MEDETDNASRNAGWRRCLKYVLTELRGTYRQQQLEARTLDWGSLERTISIGPPETRLGRRGARRGWHIPPDWLSRPDNLDRMVLAATPLPTVKLRRSLIYARGGLIHSGRRSSSSPDSIQNDLWVGHTGGHNFNASAMTVAHGTLRSKLRTGNLQEDWNCDGQRSNHNYCALERVSARLELAQLPRSSWAGHPPGSRPRDPIQDIFGRIIQLRLPEAVSTPRGGRTAIWVHVREPGQRGTRRATHRILCLIHHNTETY